MSDHTELNAYFADILRAEATEALTLSDLLSGHEVARYKAISRATARHITEISNEGGAVMVTCGVDGFYLTRTFYAGDLLDHLENAIKWATSKERRAWADLPVVE
jgi:hypothetical protein